MEQKLKLYNIKNLNIWHKFTNMFSEEYSIVNMQDLLPEHFYEEWLKDYEESKTELLLKDKNLNYLKTYDNQQDIFKNIFSAKINLLSYRVFKELEKNETIISNLNSFKPNKGYANIVKYSQTSTVTGRLINTKNSPKILTLPSRCRKIFESRWQNNGELLYVDFKTLEPRVIRKINGMESPYDIYTAITETLDFNVDRVIIKRGIISTLYGLNTCIKGLSEERSNAVLSATKEYFDLNNILLKASEINDIGCRNNFFGRPI